MNTSRIDARYILICTGLVLLACVLCFPLVELGVNDDWSYTKTAFDTARTGHIVYNGWSAAMLGAQAYWGALFVRLFGEHFWAVRLSTLVLLPAIIAICYRLHRLSDISPTYSLVGTLGIFLSPFVLPYSVTFMTELPGLLPFLGSIYAVSQVARMINDHAGVTRRFLFWLLVATVAAQIGGSVRQVFWSVPVICLCWLVATRVLWRKRAPEAIWLVVTIAVNATLAAVWNHWFESQEGAIREQLLLALGMLTDVGARAIGPLIPQTEFLLLTVVAMALPCVIMAIPDMISTIQKSFSRRIVLITLFASGIVIATSTWALWNQSLFPWLGNTVLPDGIWYGTVPNPVGGSKTVTKVLPILVLLLISLATYTGILLMGLVALLKWDRRFRDRATLATAPPPPIMEMLTVWTAFYIALLVFKWVVPFSVANFDRYLIPVLPTFTIAFLRCIPQDGFLPARRAALYVGSLIIAVGAFFGIASTHDYFEQMRAIQMVTDRLQAQGYKRNQIMGGFEFDGWTQIQEQRLYNDIRMVHSAEKYRVPPPDPGFATDYSFWKYTPCLQPSIVLSVQPFPNLTAVPEPNTEFHCWLPPYRRQVYLWRVDPSKFAPFQPLTNKATRDMLSD